MSLNLIGGNIKIAGGDGTKAGVDSENRLKVVISYDGNGGEVGRYVLGNGITTGTVLFTSAFEDTSYTVHATMMNTIDAVISIYPVTITDISVAGFSFELAGATDSANYVLSWTAMYTVGDIVAGSNGTNFGSIITTSGTYTGDTMTVTVDDASSVLGSVLTQAADFNYDRADADAAATAPGYCMALTTSSGSKQVLLKGQVCDTSWNWSAGKLYLSETTGEMTQTKPSDSGDQIQVLGWALSANTIFFDPVIMIVEVA
jgi:hypothetical protein